MSEKNAVPSGKESDETIFYKNVPDVVIRLSQKTRYQYIRKGKVSILDAYCDLIYDYYMKNKVSYRDYAKNWCWDRKIATAFINCVGFRITTTKNQHSKGYLMKEKKGHQKNHHFKKIEPALSNIFNKLQEKITSIKKKKNHQNRNKKKKKIIKNKKNNALFEEIINYLNKTRKSKFKATTKNTQWLINSLLNQGFTIEDFKKVIWIKCKQWEDNEEFKKYLRPQTLFSEKFESYLQEFCDYKEGRSKKPQKKEYEIHT